MTERVDGFIAYFNSLRPGVRNLNPAMPEVILLRMYDNWLTEQWMKTTSTTPATSE